MILNNTQHDRDLQAEIPFSWFVAYAKYDILKKRISDKYTVRGFFYNDYKKTRKDINSYKEKLSKIVEDEEKITCYVKKSKCKKERYRYEKTYHKIHLGKPRSIC